VVAAELRAQILSGSLPPGSLLPSQKEIAATYNVAVGTANRVAGLLEQWGLIAVHRGHRAVVLEASASAHGEPAASSDVGSTLAPTDEGPQYWLATLRGPDGTRYPPRLVRGCRADPATFRSHLVNIARIEARDRTDAGEAWISEFELELARPTGGAAVVTLRW
jgi:DNA-binding transcriptional MocR family regulator